MMKATTCFILAIFFLWSSRELHAARDDFDPPKIEHEPCGLFQVGKPVEIWARFTDNSGVFDPKLIYRSKGKKEWRTQSFVYVEEKKAHKATIPLGDAQEAIFYLIEVFDDQGNGPSRYGNPEAPIRMWGSNSVADCSPMIQELSTDDTTKTAEKTDNSEPPPAKKTPPAKVVPLSPQPSANSCDVTPKPVYCRGVFWFLMGSVAFIAAAGVVYAVLSRPPGDERVPDQVALTITAPDPTSQSALVISW